MTRLAIAGDPEFAISLADAPKATGAPNYTLETLRSLRAELPPKCSFYCLMGADSFVGLQRWHRAAEIPFVAPLIVASRPGQPLDGLKALLPQGLTMVPATGSELEEPSVPKSNVPVKCFALLNMAGERTPFYLLPGLDVEISASEIRTQVQSDEGLKAKVHGLLPEVVADYVRAHGLYR
jgi:nicotinate-nucleotide adenylyltransferase